MSTATDAETPNVDAHPRRRGLALSTLVVGVLGVLVALVLPLAPVWADSTTVTWPEQGRAPESTTAFFVPYAPAGVHVQVPCEVVRAGQERDAATTLVSSNLPGRPTKGFTVSTADGEVLVLLGGRQVYRAPIAAGDCSVVLESSARGSMLRVGAESIPLPNDHVREIFAFATDLPPDQARGLEVRARTSTWFESSPTAAKNALIAAQLALAASALALLVVGGRRRRDPRPVDDDRPPRRGRSLRACVDGVIVAALGYWTVFGPRTPDDSFTEGIVRNALDSGAFTNYYRWENSAEAPFTLVLHLVEPLVAMQANPLVLRLPSFVAALATWVLLSRGVLPVVLSHLGRHPGVRGLTAVCLLVWWLPFNLGVRPEPFVALGTTAVLTCVLRGTDRRDGSGLALLGLGGLAAGLTFAVNPVGITAAAPVVVLAPRIWRTLRGPIERTGSRLVPFGWLALVGCLGAVGLVAMFADQSWFGVSRATELHRFYGPNVAWFQEIRRYEYLLGFDEQGGLGRRLPVLLTIAVGGCAALLLARGAHHLSGMRFSYVPLATVALALGLLWVAPSKWTHYFGALAGFGAAGLVVGIVLVTAGAREWSHQRAVSLIGATGTAATVLAASLAFSGKNTWFLFSHYGVPHDDGPFRPLNTPLPWLVLVLVLLALPRLLRRTSSRRMLAHMPGIVGSAAVVVGVVVMLVSFAVAPVRQADSYSVGGQNLAHLTGGSCGIVDDVVITRDLPTGVLTPASGTEALTGFTAQGGYPSNSAPPEPPGTGSSTYLWGSFGDGALSTGSLDSQWFALPELRGNQELAVSVAGRTGDGNRVALEFARSTDGAPQPLGQHVLDDTYKDSDERPTYPSDRVVEDKPQDNPQWRTLHVGSSQVPAGADLVRVRAVDATTDAGGWIAVTGPRVRQIEPLRQFFTDRGPTYVDWSMVWAAPCVRNSPKVADGLVEAPTTLLNPPEKLGFDGRAAYVRAIGGSFAGVDEVGNRKVVPTRLLGSQDRPEYADWGQLVQVSYPVRRDAYDTRTTSERRWGWKGDRALLGDSTG